MEEDRLKAAHEEETEYFIGVDWGCEGEEASIVFVPKGPNGPQPIAVHRDEVELIKWWQGSIPVIRGVKGFRGTASVIHDGTWQCERLNLERRERQSKGEEIFLVTVWNRPRGLRGRYLGIRSCLWKWQRAILRTCNAIERMVAGRR